MKAFINYSYKESNGFDEFVRDKSTIIDADGIVFSSIFNLERYIEKQDYVNVIRINNMTIIPVKN